MKEKKTNKFHVIIKDLDDGEIWETDFHHSKITYFHTEFFEEDETLIQMTGSYGFMEDSFLRCKKSHSFTYTLLEEN